MKFNTRKVICKVMSFICHTTVHLAEEEMQHLVKVKVTLKDMCLQVTCVFFDSVKYTPCNEVRTVIPVFGLVVLVGHKFCQDNIRMACNLEPMSYCKRGNFRAGVIFALLSFSRKLPARENKTHIQYNLRKPNCLRTVSEVRFSQ